MNVSTIVIRDCFYITFGALHLQSYNISLAISVPVEQIIDFYLKGLRPSTDKRIILASDGIGTDVEVLNIINDQQNSNEQLQLLTIAPYSSHAEMAGLKAYISNRTSGVKNGTTETDNLLQQYKNHCSDSEEVCNNALIDARDSTLQTIQAVVAFLNAFKSVHNSRCASQQQSGFCQPMKDSRTFYPQLLNELVGSSSNAIIDSLNVSIRFNNNGELYKETVHPAYTLNKVSNRQYATVGTYSLNGTWMFDSPSSLPNIPSRCRAQCEKCLEETPPYIYRHHKSKYIIAGTGPIYNRQDQHGCGGNVSTNGFIIMESFYFAVAKIREETGIDFSTLFIDTCFAKLGTHSTMNKIFLSENEATLTDTDGVIHNFSPSKFVVFIGDYASGVSLALQTYLNLYNIPQISYFSTSTWLTDPLRYPMFLRNVPSDDAQARMMIEIVKINGWDTIGLIYTDSVYGQTGAQLIIDYAKQNGVCIQYKYVTSTTEDGVSKLVQDMRETDLDDRLPRPILAFAENDIFKMIFSKIRATFTKWAERGNFLIGSETWNRDNDVIADAGTYAFGSLSFSFSEANFKWTTANNENKFRQYLQGQRPSDYAGNPLFLNFWQQYFECYLPDDPLSVYERKCSDLLTLTDPPTHSDVVPIDFEHIAGKYLVMAGLSVAYAIDEAFNEGICSGGDGTGVTCSKLFESDAEVTQDNFFRLLRTTKIPMSIDSRRKEYLPYLSDSGDGVRNYQIYNVIKEGDNTPKYTLVYNITDGVISQVRKPTFYYASGTENREVIDTSCRNCPCLDDTSRQLPQVNDQTTTSDTPSEWSAPKWLLPLLIVIVISVLLLLIIVIVILYMRYRTRADGNKNNETISMQYVSPSSDSK